LHSLTFKNQETWKPRNLFKLTAGLSIILLLFSIGCKKSIDLNESSRHNIQPSHKSTPSNPVDTGVLVNIESLYYGDPANISATLYSPSISNLYIQFSDGSDTVLSLSAPMPAFSDTNALFEAIKILDYRPTDTMEAFASSKGYISLLTDYVLPKFTSTSGYFENEEIKDFTVAAIENKDAAVRIGDSIFISFYDKKETAIIDIGNSSYTTKKWKTHLPCEYEDWGNRYFGYYKSDWTPGFEGDYFRVTGAKENYSGAYRAYVRMLIYLEVWYTGIYNSGYVLSKSNKFNILKDQWYIVKYRHKKSSTYTTISDPAGVYYMSWRQRNFIDYKFASKTGLFNNAFCVPKFERTHNWIKKFEEDVHNNYWP